MIADDWSRWKRLLALKRRNYWDGRRLLRLFGEELERVHVAWSEKTEVATVQRRQLLLIQPFDDRQNSSVHKADVGVCITIAEFPRAAVIVGKQVFDEVSAIDDVVKKRHQHAGMKPGTDPVVDFDQDRSRDE